MSEAIISASSALIGALLGAGIVFWQTKAQRAAGIELQRQSAREAYMVELHRRILVEIEAVHEALDEVTSYVAFLPATYTTYRNFARDRIEPAPIRQRALELLDINAQFGRAHSRLVQTLEDFEIVEQNSLVFQRALVSTSYTLHTAFQEMYKRLSMYLPMDLPPKGEGVAIAAFPVFPSDEAVQELGKLIHGHYMNSLQMKVYLYDLRREAHNILLGHLFPTRLAPRIPEDPDAIVLTTDPSKARGLIKYFETEGDWGDRLSADCRQEGARAPGATDSS